MAETMKAVRVLGYGELRQRLRVAEVDRPAIGPDDVLIKVHAASINPIDIHFVSGKLRRIQPLALPGGLGFDASGVIAAVGAAVRDFKPGDEVYARAPRQRVGTFAEYAAIRAEYVAPRPAGLSHAEAAALPLVALTTVQGLVDRAGARPGQRILIHAGSGGVGSFAIQYARRVLGLEVATTTSARNAEWVAALGADRVIAYDREDYRAGGPIYDLVYDTLGDAYTTDAFAVLAPGGTVVSIAGPPDRFFADQVGAGPLLRAAMWLMRRRVERLAARKRARYFRFLTESSGRQLRAIAAQVESGAIRPVIDRVFGLDESIAALEYVAQKRAKGKVIIAMPGSAQ